MGVLRVVGPQGDFSSANIHASWLLRRYAIDLEKVQLSLSRDAHAIKLRLQK